VKFLAFLLRVYSVMFHLTLSVFLLAIAGIALLRHQQLNIALPFADKDVLFDVTLLGGVGLLCTLLAFTRSFKLIFVLWTAILEYIMLKSFFLGPYSVYETDQLRGAEWFTFGALGAFFGAAWALKPTRRSAFF